MLIQKLTTIIQTLDRLIEITEQDIKNIKEAKHEEVFKNIKEKENLSYKFASLKNEIDKILISRNKPIEEIFSTEEEKLFDTFREKLETFYHKHKYFSRLAISVANFYNALTNQIKQTKKISYTEEANFNSNLQLRG